MEKLGNIRLIPVLVWLAVVVVPTTVLLIGSVRVLRTFVPDIIGFFLQFVVVILISLLLHLVFWRFTSWWFNKKMRSAFVQGEFALALKRLNFGQRYLMFIPRTFLTIWRMYIVGSMNRPQEALELALKTIQRVNDESDERHRVALLTLAEVAHIQKQYDVAYDYLKRLVDMKANFVNIILKELSILSLKMGEPEQALELVNKSLELLADTEYTQNVFKKAPQDIQKAVGRTEAVKAWILAARGHVEEVESLLQNAIIKVENDHPPLLAEFHLYTGRAYHAMNNLDEARRHLQKASELDPQGIDGGEAREILATLDSGAA